MQPLETETFPAIVCELSLQGGPMPAKNLYHDAVIVALQADGWRITHDPLTLSFGGKDLFVDLGAERVAIAAERGAEKIAVEVQSFLNTSLVRDLEQAVGQDRCLSHSAERNRTRSATLPRCTSAGV